MAVKKETQVDSERIAHIDISLHDGEYTSYEKARIIGSRALQIAQGATPNINMTELELESVNYNPIEIAKKEFEAGVIPIGIRRNPVSTHAPPAE